MSTPPSHSPIRVVVSTFGAVVRPIQEFFRLQAASGIVLLTAALIALAWANSSASASYVALFEMPVAVSIGAASATFTVHQAINDALMAIFFFLVGMEIKRELVAGELRTFRRAILPAIAAIGGMVVPSGIFLLFNWNGPGQHGWGIPMATDIAFAIGCLTLLGKRVPHALLVFLTALAIFDDIGGIMVIALFYGHGLHPSYLLGAAGVTVALWAMNKAYVRNGVAYALGGVALWYMLHHAGIHATIAGVVLGLMIPARPSRRAREVLADLGAHTGRLLQTPADEEIDNASILQIEEKLEDLEAPLNRFVHALHPWVAFLIMPLFALANSGVSVTGMTASDAAGPVTLGTAVGLALGKPIGILGATALAVRLGVAQRPANAGWMRILGVSTVAGIGFTVALFIGALAYPGHPELLNEAKLGILLGSAVAGIAGMAILRATGPMRGTSA